MKLFFYGDGSALKTLKLYRNTITSDVNNIRRTTNEIIDFMQHNIEMPDECCLFELKVILNELIINAVKHGNKWSKDKSVNIIARIINCKYFCMSVEDQGEGYDYNKLISSFKADVNEDFDSYDLQETGRGISIVKNLSDRLSFNSKGNKVTVIKRVSKSCKV